MSVEVEEDREILSTLQQRQQHHIIEKKLKQDRQQHNFYSVNMISGLKSGVSSGPVPLTKTFSNADNDQGHLDINSILICLIA